MIGFMPSIYPDELVYSWFCRYFVHSGYATNKMALNDLLYNRHCNPSKEFIGHLNPDIRNSPQTSWLTLSDLGNKKRLQGYALPPASAFLYAYDAIHTF